MTCSSSPTWAYMARKISSSPGNTNGGPGCHDCQIMFRAVSQAFFCWRLLGLIPGGTPFSQLNKGVRDAMSATTKRDV